MVDNGRICCMCGDVGFRDRLFQCLRCISRFQHSYCSNYYVDCSSDAAAPGVCDWCRSEEKAAPAAATPGHGSRGAFAGRNAGGRPDYACGEKIKQGHEVGRGGKNVAATAGGSGGSSSSSAAASASASTPKPAGRRYKLLKDVMC